MLKNYSLCDLFFIVSLVISPCIQLLNLVLQFLTLLIPSIVFYTSHILLFLQRPSVGLLYICYSLIILLNIWNSCYNNSLMSISVNLPSVSVLGQFQLIGLSSYKLFNSCFFACLVIFYQILYIVNLNLMNTRFFYILINTFKLYSETVKFFRDNFILSVLTLKAY